MRLKLITLLCVALVFVLTACAEQQGTGKTLTSTAASEPDEKTGAEQQSLPAIIPPQISITDSRQHQNGGWVVRIPEAADHIYQVSGDNDAWVEFSFSVQMDEADVIDHLVVEPAAEITTDWSDRGYKHCLRVHIAPSAVSPLKIGLAAGARNAHASMALGEDIMVTLERFPAPWATMSLQAYPAVKMEQYGIYWVSPQEAAVVMEFSKPIDRESLAEALAGIAPADEFELSWLDDQKVNVKFAPPAAETRIYDLALTGARDQDGVLVSIAGQIELRVIPELKVKSLNLTTGQQVEVISTGGGYAGGVISPDGARAVFWELACGVGDARLYRYWLQDLIGGEKALLTESGDFRVKWFPDGSQVQIENKLFAADGRELESPLAEKSILGFDLGPEGQMAYLSWREPGQNKPAVDLFYQQDGEWKSFKDFSYPLFNSNGFLLPMNPAFDPAGERLAVIRNLAGRDQLQAASAYIINLKTGEQSLLADRALNVFWSPRGDYLAVGKVDGVEVLNTSGELKLKLPDHDFYSIAGWSLDGQYLLFKEYDYEQSAWLTGLVDITCGQEQKIPGIPLGCDNNGNLYLITALSG